MSSIFRVINHLQKLLQQKNKFSIAGAFFDIILNYLTYLVIL